MQHSRAVSAGSAALLTFPELAPAVPARDGLRMRVEPAAFPVPRPGRVKATVLSFATMHEHGELMVSFMRARKRIFIDRLGWTLPETEGMEFDQYDTPLARWIVLHEFGEVVGGIRLTPTTARCGIYSYMLRDAQKGLLHAIPTDVLFFEAPVSPTIWEASRLFIDDDIPAQRRQSIQALLMETLTGAARELGATHVIGIVPSVFSRWLRRLNLDAIPVGPKFAIDGTGSQAALFRTAPLGN